MLIQFFLSIELTTLLLQINPSSIELSGINIVEIRLSIDLFTFASGKWVDADVMCRWKRELDEISTGKLLSIEDKRELTRFLSLLLQHVISISPLYELK